MKTRILHTRFWKDSFIVGLSPQEKLLFNYLLTNDQVNIIGIYELPDKYILADLDISADELVAAKEKFKGRIDFYNGWVKIVKHDSYNSFTGSAEKAKEKEKAQVPPELLDTHKIEKKEAESAPTPRVNPRVDPLSNTNDNHNDNHIGGSGGKFSTIDSLQEGDLQQVAEDYEVTTEFVHSRLDDMRNWCSAKGKSYRDYKAALRNWVKKDASGIMQHEKSMSRKGVRSYDATQMVRGDNRGQGDNPKPGRVSPHQESGSSGIAPRLVPG